MIKIARILSKFAPDNIVAEVVYHIQTRKDKWYKKGGLNEFSCM